MNNVSSPKTDGSCQDNRLTRLLFGLLIAYSQISNSLKHVISHGSHLATICEPFFGILRLAGTSEYARRLSLCIFFNLVQWVKLGISTKHGVELASDVKWQMRWRQARIAQPDAKQVASLRGVLSKTSPSWRYKLYTPSVIISITVCRVQRTKLPGCAPARRMRLSRHHPPQIG